MKQHRTLLRKAAAGILSATVLMSSFMSAGFAPVGVSAADTQNPQATLTVDVDPAANTGDIIHGAAGFLYGVSSEDVPTTNTIVPLKSKILVTKGAVGTEHPYGDALDVAKTFLESGGEQIQMYNSNYYGVFGVTASIERYCNDLKNYICPAVVAWKEAWKKEHGTPEAPKDNIGARIDIDKALVYIPINEGTPAGNDFQRAWKDYHEAIRSVDPNAALAGPNEGSYNGSFTWGQSEETFVQFCADNNCMPDVYTWHEFDLYGPSVHMKDFRDIWNNRTDWTKYNEANGFEEGTIPEIPQICFNEYAETYSCGVPGRLVNWFSRIEDEKATGAMPFWHQANNLNDLAAGANQGNGAWWMAKWYGDMSGTTQLVSTSTNYNELYGISTMDEAKKISTTLFGGFTGDVTVQLNNLAKTETFSNAKAVHVTVQEAIFTGFHGVLNETPTVVEGAYPVNSDGSVTVKIPGTLFENAYNVTVTQAGDNEVVGLVLTNSSGDVYEAESAALTGNAVASNASTNPGYYMSSENGHRGVDNPSDGIRAVDMPTGAVMTYTINVLNDGKYKLDFLYGNGQGTIRNDMNAHDPKNVQQTFALDGGAAETITMESTLFQTMTGMKTLYYDLKAGEHTITVTTLDGVDSGMLFHDFVRVSYAGVYNQPVPSFNKVYEAELADVNRLLGHTDSTVSTQTAINGYSGGGYVTGLSGRLVSAGGGIRNTVVVEESGLYNIALRYHSDIDGEANIYVGNTAVTLDRMNKTVSLKAGADWQEVTASVYLQKGINVVDLDMTVEAALDYMRVRALPNQDHSTTIEAEDAIPDSLKDSIQIAESTGASGGKYVMGMEGAYSNPDYLEFTYNAPAAGKYQMQLFHSNEDLAGSHAYNIKTTDKYAVVEVNGQSDSPKFVLKDEDVSAKLYYFVDCGDHNPATVSTGDKLGANNSVTDRIYGEDSTGYNWGVFMMNDSEKETPGEGSVVSSPDDKAVYTSYQKACSNATADLIDGQSKYETFRYAHSQDKAGINPRYVAYKFELDPGKYAVTVGMSNMWNNGGNPTVTLIADGVTEVSKDYSMSGGARQEETQLIDLTAAQTNGNGKVELLVKATATTPTLQMTNIAISDAMEGVESDTISLPPYGEKAVAGDKLPQDIYVGELAEGLDWFIDYRNLKNDTDRYFFLNTFSDDTFREKTITLDLLEGENTIRIYNDNSWNVTYGGTQSTPATTCLTNYTPNFDKFVITPRALDTAVALKEEYKINLSSTSDGVALADKNTVTEGGEYTISMTPSSGKEIIKLLVNGADQTSAVTYDAATAKYLLKVSGATGDQNVQVYFAKPDTPKEALQALYNQYKDLQRGTYSSASWERFDNARAKAAEALKDGAQQWQINNAYDEWTVAIDNLKDIANLIYFVDCGDHGPATVTPGDDLGRYNSVTDQMYGEDTTGYRWGVSIEEEGLAKGEKETPGESSMVSSPDDKAVYTSYQKALSNLASDLVDGQSKDKTFRYAHSQDGVGINPRYVAYKFEVEPGEYTVTVGMSNTWGNGSNPTVTLSAEGSESVSEDYSMSNGDKQEKAMTIDLTNAKTNDNGRVELKVKATATSPSLQMTYIFIESKVAGRTAAEVAAEITEIPAIAAGAEKVTLPRVEEGFTVSIYSSSNEDVIDLDGNITPQADDTEVKLVLTVGKGTDTANTKEISVTVPGIGMAKVLLKQSIDAAKDFIKDGYPEHLILAVKDRFDAALRAAEAIYKDASATEEEILAADDELIMMLQYLSFTADPTGLTAAIQHAEEVIASGVYSDDAMMEAYQDALDAAKAALKDPLSTITEYEAAIKALEAAEANLNKKPTVTLNLAALNHEVSLAHTYYNTLNQFIDGAEKDTFVDKFNAAKDMLARANNGDETVTQAMVDKAATELHSAMLALRRIPSKDALQQLLADAKAYDLTRYTEESGRDLLTAIDAAQKIYDNPNADIDAVKNAETALKSAIQKLELKKSDGGKDNQGGNSAQTGDLPMTGIALLGALSLGAVLLLKKKERD